MPTTGDSANGRSPARAAAIRVLPFAAFIGLLALRGALELPEWTYAIQVALPLAILLHERAGYPELKPSAPSSAARALAFAAGIAVLLVWVAPMAGWMQIGEPSTRYVPVDAQGALRWDLIALRSAGAVIVVPVMEELFWRSFLMRWIDRRDFLVQPPAEVSGFAWISSSAVFALAHDRWLAAFLAGLAYGLLYRRTGSLRAAIAAHAITNLGLAAWVVTFRAWQYW